MASSRYRGAQKLDYEIPQRRRWTSLPKKRESEFISNVTTTLPAFFFCKSLSYVSLKELLFRLHLRWLLIFLKPRGTSGRGSLPSSLCGASWQLLLVQSCKIYFQLGVFYRYDMSKFLQKPWWKVSNWFRKLLSGHFWFDWKRFKIF